MTTKKISQLPFLINPNSYETKILEGTVIIPDISGFSHFVDATDFDTGKHIISKLLNVIIKNNTLDLQISEIEGDAVLFFKFGKRISAKKILQQFCVMQKAFRNEVTVLEKQFQVHINLSLKLIAHYGPLTKYSIGKFEKLYGQTVVEAHRLLKNSVEINSYALLSDTLLNPERKSEFIKVNELIEETGCEVYDGTKKLCYTVFSSENDLCKKVN